MEMSHPVGRGVPFAYRISGFIDNYPARALLGGMQVTRPGLIAAATAFVALVGAGFFLLGRECVGGRAVSAAPPAAAVAVNDPVPAPIAPAPVPAPASAPSPSPAPPPMPAAV